MIKKSFIGKIFIGCEYINVMWYYLNLLKKWLVIVILILNVLMIVIDFFYLVCLKK